MSETPEKTDIIIVGAGLVGLSFAYLAAQLGFTVRILETHLPDILTQATDNHRPLTLSYGSYQILRDAGLWAALQATASPVCAVHVSEQGRLGFTRFTASEMQKDALGFVVPFSTLHHTLYTQVAAQKNVIFTGINAIHAIQEK